MSDARVKKMCAYSKNPTAMAETLAQRFISQKIRPLTKAKAQPLTTASEWANIINQYTRISGDENVQSHGLQAGLDKPIKGREGSDLVAEQIDESWYLGDTDVLLKFMVDSGWDGDVNIYVSLLVEDGNARLTGIMSPKGSDISSLASQVVKYLNCTSGSCMIQI